MERLLLLSLALRMHQNKDFWVEPIIPLMISTKYGNVNFGVELTRVSYFQQSVQRIILVNTMDTTVAFESCT